MGITMKQKDIFLKSEGNAWYARNKKVVASSKLPENDALLKELIDFFPKSNHKVKILEIGCGDGTRLNWIKDNLNADCYGIEPSAQAALEAVSKGIDVKQGTADNLPFDSHSFDIVIFGFCLYLCDREDLFCIASEADRVLRNPGWLMILDFYSTTSYKNPYHHFEGVQSYKMDYRTLFSWHPDYYCVTQKVRHFGEDAYTDNKDNWTAVSVMRKGLNSS